MIRELTNQTSQSATNCFPPSPKKDKKNSKKERNMNSWKGDCTEAKQKYEACFNQWYSESFLKYGNGDLDECKPLFQEYRKCLDKELKKSEKILTDFLEKLERQKEENEEKEKLNSTDSKTNSR